MMGGGRRDREPSPAHCPIPCTTRGQARRRCGDESAATYPHRLKYRAPPAGHCANQLCYLPPPPPPPCAATAASATVRQDARRPSATQTGRCGPLTAAAAGPPRDTPLLPPDPPHGRSPMPSWTACHLGRPPHRRNAATRRHELAYRGDYRAWRRQRRRQRHSKGPNRSVPRPCRLAAATKRW